MIGEIAVIGFLIILFVSFWLHYDFLRTIEKMRKGKK